MNLRKLTKAKLAALFLLTGIIMSLLVPVSLFAQGNIVIDPNDSVVPGFGQINFPTFFNLDQIRHFSIWSYVALFTNVVFVAIATFWVFLIIRSAVSIMNSQGEEAKIQEAMKKIRSVFASIAFMFIFVAVIVLVGAFFGLGAIWEWPKKLSVCEPAPGETTGKLYITLRLEFPNLTEQDIERSCFKQ